MGFLDNKKIPEQDKKFFFRQDYLTCIKYAIYNFYNNNNIYYPNLFYIEGQEGIGKTFLLEQIEIFSEKSKMHNLLVVNIDAKDIILSTATGIINFMVQVRNKILEKESYLQKAFEDFDKAYNDFIKGELTEDLKELTNSKSKEIEENKLKSNIQAETAKLKLANLRNKNNPKKNEIIKENKELVINEFKEDTKTNVNILKVTTIQASSNYAPLNKILETALPRKKSGEADIKAIAKNLTSIMESLKRSNIKEVDYKMILFKKFLKAFDIVCANRKVVLIIDSFEKIQPIYNFIFNNFIKTLRTEFIFIMAGQLDLEKELKEKFDTSLHYIYMQNFTYLEVEEFLRKNDIINEPSIVESVFELTRGIPLALSLVASVLKDFKSDVFKIMNFLNIKEKDYETLRYINTLTLDNIHPNDRKIIVLLALLRKTDSELIADIAGVFDTNKLLKNLSDKYFFIHEKKGLQEMLKIFTRTYAKHDLNALYQEIYRRAYEFYSEKLEKDPKNKELITNQLYYYFRLNEHEAYKELLSIISDNLLTDIDFCQQIVHDMAYIGLSKKTREDLNILKECIPYFILKDYKKILPLMEAISSLQKEELEPSMKLLDNF
ncbi:MAG: hypothetical protein KatS3mg068_2121 [Candidatus Sericytochromatia bacterium]|nr:MAG: hypothetical protein KatS3mg068_2121 [Candidatus Sericytochromatia bacterium]